MENFIFISLLLLLEIIDLPILGLQAGHLVKCVIYMRFCNKAQICI